MSKYDTAINNTNTVGVGCGVWSVIYSWLQSVDWVAVGSFLGMAIAYLLNIYFNIQRHKDDKAKNKREIEILENKVKEEIKIIRENAERKAAIELDILKEQLAEEKRKNKQAEKEREERNKELLNWHFGDIEK